MEENYFVPLFKEQDRTNIVVYRSVKYSKIPIGIPRCERCREIHQSAANKSKLYAWTGAVAGFLLSISIWGVLGVFGIIPCLLFGIIGAHYIENKLVSDQGILTKMEGAKQDETVQDLVISGWSFNQPTA
jgi:hypothetical protein